MNQSFDLSNPENCLKPTPKRPTLEWAVWVLSEMSGMRVIKGNGKDGIGLVVITMGMQKWYTLKEIAKYFGVSSKYLKEQLRHKSESVLKSQVCCDSLLCFD